MNKLHKNLLLGVIVAAASLTGYFIQSREMQGYVVETETNASDIYTSKPPEIVDDSSAPEREDGLININTASLSQLQRLKGIGPEKAESIIRFREENGNFEVIEDIMKVSGIGRKTFDNIKDFITVS